MWCIALLLSILASFLHPSKTISQKESSLPKVDSRYVAAISQSSPNSQSFSLDSSPLTALHNLLKNESYFGQFAPSPSLDITFLTSLNSSSLASANIFFSGDYNLSLNEQNALMQFINHGQTIIHSISAI